MGARCDACPLKGQTVVPPSPSFGKTKLVIIGEGPGKLEVREKRPFVGPSGKLLDQVLNDASFDRRDAWITNTVCCRLDDERDLPRAAACCSMRLANELAALPAEAPILALGASAAKAVIGKGGILKARGFIWKIDAIKAAALKGAQRVVNKRRATRKTVVNDERLAKAESSLWLLQARAKLEGRIVIPSIHPAFLLRGADAWMPLLRIDVNRAVRYSHHPLKLESDVRFIETDNLVVVKRQLAKLPKHVSIDVESDGPDPLHCKLDCVGIIGFDPEKGVLVGPALIMNPWRKKFSALLNDALRERVSVGHNLISFDETVLRRYGVRMPQREDTLLAHHAFASHVRQGLDHVASVYCLYGNTPVLLANGRTEKIAKIVANKLPVHVMTLGPDGMEAKRVIAWHRNRVLGQRWVRIRTTDQAGRKSHAYSRGLVCTPDHQILTARGWVRADAVRRGDKVAVPERALTKEEKGALLGTLLGDSSLAFGEHKSGRHGKAVVYGAHKASVGLSEAKAKALRGFLYCGSPTTKPHGFSTSPQTPYRTASSRQLSALARLIYDNHGRKRLKREALNALGPVGLAWWFADDGCKHKKGLRIATNCFSLKDVRVARAWLQRRFGPVSIYSTKRKGKAGREYFLGLRYAAAERFCVHIAPYLPTCVRYKLPAFRKWPAFVRAPLSTHNDPLFVRVVSVAEYLPAKGRRNMRDYSYCLTVEDNRNFFTPVALVSNCDAEPWKQIHRARGNDEKGQGFAVKELAKYNASDVGLTALAWMRMAPDLAREQSVYEGSKRLAEFCVKMQRAGIRVDVARRDELAKKLRSRAAGLKGEMRKLLRKPSFSPNKTADIRHALFTSLKAPLFALTPTGMPSTASGTLEALQKTESRAGTLSDLIIRYRACGKTVSTFLDGIDVARDGRVHASWRAFGTVTARLSCRDPNLQNLVRRVLLEWLSKQLASHNPTKAARAKALVKELGDEAYQLETRVREIYIPGAGNAFVYFDLSQSEMRAAAYLSGDDKFIETCESGDVHTGNARILFPYAEEELKDPKGAGKPFRDVAKNGAFGILYDAAAATIFSFLQSKGFDVSLGDVEAMFNEIRSTYTRYYEFCEENLEYCRRHGHLREALSSRIRWFGFYPKPSEIFNYMVQAFIAALMNERLLIIDSRLPKGAKTVAQVHDSGIIETPIGLVDEVKGLVTEVWKEQVYVPTSQRTFVMPIDLKVGERLSDF
jgi:uracil-DNA glycosylase family 4